ncbi:MAG TPA: ABC transporter ATP-binding protein [Magnetospirillaceae bacterium]|jgi:branched-chain amino acid transport system ATP-binding protein
MAEPLLALDTVSAGYDEALVLHSVSLSLDQGDSLALLGRNGMGKSTLLATIMGHTRLRGGTVRFSGRDLTQSAPHHRALAGIAWVAQEREIFPSLTVEENLTVAARGTKWTLDRVYAFFPRLKERRRNMGNHLSGGEQQMLAIGRALMTNPSVILLDEPLEGLAPVIVEELTADIGRMIKDEGVTAVIVEQHAQAALGLANKAVVLDRGRIAYAGEAAALAKDAETLNRLVGVRGGTKG